jgi:hypothetical protein
MLAVSYVEGKFTYIKIVTCNNHKVEEMLENYENKNFKYEYKEESNYITNIIFDINQRYLIGYG